MKKKKKEVKIYLYIIFLSIVIIASIYFTIMPTFIGYTVLQGYQVDIANASNFNYNNEEIEITDNIIKLKANISSTNWTTYSQEIFPITKAYYGPEDKTSKITEQDNNSQEISSSKIATLIFDSDLNNGDIINLYLKDEETTNVYLCNVYEECASSNLGSIYFPNQAGYYNLIVQNLNAPQRIFNLNSDEKIETDFINSTGINITKFWYDHEDKTSKVSVNDNTTLEANENEILDIVFSEGLQDNDIIQLYLKNEEATNLYLCNAGEECTTSNLGQIYFPNQDGSYNITLQSINYPKKVFNLNSDEEIKVDFIEAIRITETNHSETNITYPTTANITTQDFTVENLMNWDLLIIEETLNGQSISYEYSADSGGTWQQVSEDKNLSAVNSTRIRIKVILNSNTSETPQLLSINITYSSKSPETYYEINNSGAISTIKDENITVNSSSSKSELNIVATESLSNIQFNISDLEDVNARPATLSRVKEIEILSQELQGKISTATIKIYYTNEEVNNLNESTLKLYYYNETSQEWQTLESTMNTEENYIQANLQHFSIYGIFGESTQQENTGSSGSTSSGGSGGKREFTRGTTATQQQTQQESGAAEAEEEANKAETSQEKTEQEIIPTEAQISEQLTFTGNVVRIGKVLTEGKVNRSLWILIAILIVAYIIAKIEERK